MRPDKQTALQLRKQGKSYQEISKSIGVPKSTLSNWFRGIAWSEETKNYLSNIARQNARKRMTTISRRRIEELKRVYSQEQIKAEKQFYKFTKDRLFIAGLMVYWSEGDSKLENGAIRVCNSDPLMIKLFYKFLKNYLPEVSDKAKMYLILYPDLDETKCKKHWSEKVGVPLNKFFKSSFIKGRHPNKRLAYGIGSLTINSRLYKEKIITWINLIKKENLVRV